VSEVNAGIEQVLIRNLSHDNLPVIRLTLGELSAAACFALAWFFALDFARVAGNETCLFEGWATRFILLHEGTGDSETDGFCLARNATTVYIDHDVVLTGIGSRYFEGLQDRDTVQLEGEVGLQYAVVDHDSASAWAYKYAGHRGLSSAYGYDLIDCCHVREV
jgi:hypothetical protein